MKLLFRVGHPRSDPSRAEAPPALEPQLPQVQSEASEAMLSKGMSQSTSEDHANQQRRMDRLLPPLPTFSLSAMRSEALKTQPIVLVHVPGLQQHSLGQIVEQMFYTMGLRIEDSHDGDRRSLPSSPDAVAVQRHERGEWHSSSPSQQDPLRPAS